MNPAGNALRPQQSGQQDRFGHAVTVPLAKDSGRPERFAPGIDPVGVVVDSVANREEEFDGLFPGRCRVSDGVLRESPDLRGVPLDKFRVR